MPLTMEQLQGLEDVCFLRLTPQEQVETLASLNNALSRLDSLVPLESAHLQPPLPSSITELREDTITPSLSQHQVMALAEGVDGYLRISGMMGVD